MVIESVEPKKKWIEKLDLLTPGSNDCLVITIGQGRSIRTIISRNQDWLGEKKFKIETIDKTANKAGVWRVQ